MAASSLDHEYGPISGLGDFTKLSAELAFGTSGDILKAGKVSGGQGRHVSGFGPICSLTSHTINATFPDKNVMI